MAIRFPIEAVFRAHDRMTGPIRRMQQRMERFNSKAQRGLRDADRMASAAIGGFRRLATTIGVAGVALGAIGASVVSTGADFEQALVGAAARMPGEVRRGTEAFAALEEAAKRVGAETEFSASQAAGGLRFLAMAGFDAEKAVAALPSLVDFATASELELGRASDIATDALGAFGMASSDAATNAQNMQRIMDVMSSTANMANTDVDALFETIIGGGQIAQTAGVSIEEFSAVAAVLANAGVKGAEAGVALRNSLLELAAPASAGRRGLRQLGVQLALNERGGVDLMGTLGNLSAATADMSRQQKIQALSAIFGRRTIGPLIAQMDAGEDVIGGFTAALNAAGGSTENIARTLRDTTSGDLRSFSSAVESVKLAIFDVVRGPLRGVVQSMTDWARENREVIASGIQGFIDWFRGALPEIVTWGRRLAIIGSVFLTAAAGIKAASAAAFIFNLIMTANPIVLIGTAIVAAIALIIAFWPEISAFFAEVWEGIKDVATRVGAWFASMWEGIKSVASGIVSAIGESIASIWGPVRDFLVGAFEFVVGFLTLLFGPIVERMRPLFDFLVAAAGWVMDHWEPIRAFFELLVGAVVDHFTRKWNEIATGARIVFDLISGYLERKWNGIVEAATVAFDLLKAVWSPIAGFFEFLWDSIVDSFTRKFESITNGIGFIVDAVRGVGRETIGSEGSRGEGSGAGSPSPQVITPSERVSRSVEERNTTSRSEVTIRDDSGRARVTRQPRGGAQLRLEPSGAL